MTGPSRRSPDRRALGPPTGPDRRARRNQLLLAGALPSLVALLVAAVVALTLVRNDLGRSAYHRGDHRGAVGWFAANRWLDAVEPWIAAFNEGDGHYRDQQWGAALSDFRAALRLVPPEHECEVRLNLALTRERLGDAEVQPGSDRAEDAWRAGRSVLAEGRCAMRQEIGELGRDAATTDRRLADKIADLLEQRQRERRAATDPEQRRREARLEEATRRARVQEELERDKAQQERTQRGRGRSDRDRRDYTW